MIFTRYYHFYHYFGQYHAGSTLRIPPSPPRRSKVRFAPTSFYAYGKKDVIRPLPCSSFPTATHFVGLAVGVPPCGRHFSLYWEISILTVPCKKNDTLLACRSFWVPPPDGRLHPFDLVPIRLCVPDHELMNIM